MENQKANNQIPQLSVIEDPLSKPQPTTANTKRKINVSPTPFSNDINILFNHSFVDQNNNYNNNISTYLTNQLLPEDIIGSSSFYLQGTPRQKARILPLSNALLIRDWTKGVRIRNELIKMIKPKEIKIKNGKIIFTLFKDMLYKGEFLSYYVKNRFARLLKKVTTRKSEKNVTYKCENEVVSSRKQSSSSNNDKDFIVNFPLNAKQKKSYLRNKTMNNYHNNALNFEEHDTFETHDQNNTIEPEDESTGTRISGMPEILRSKINANSHDDKRWSGKERAKTQVNSPVMYNQTEGNNCSNSSKTLNKKNTIKAGNSNKSISSFYWTKIPEKVKDSKPNLWLDMAYTKAKDAARVVRRWEYAYSMKMSIMYNKPIYKKKAKIIQKWWREVSFANQNKNKIIIIQRYYRGHLARRAFIETWRLYFDIWPFLAVVDKILSRQICDLIFERWIPNYAFLKIHNIIKPKADNIIKHMNKHWQIQKNARAVASIIFSEMKKIFSLPCTFTKMIVDHETLGKVTQLQARTRGYLTRNSERKMLQFGREYHPNLYFKLKYDDLIYKKKKAMFNNCFRKFRELNLKVNKGYENRYDYLVSVIKRPAWNSFKDWYNNHKNETDETVLKHRKWRTCLKRRGKGNDKLSLQKYLDRWKWYNWFYKKYHDQSICDKLKVLDALMRYNKRYHQKLFMDKLDTITTIKKENENAKLNSLSNVYEKYHCDEYNNRLINDYFQRWKRNNFHGKATEAKRTITNFFNALHEKRLKRKSNKLKYLFNIYFSCLSNAFKSWRFENIKFKIGARRFFNHSRRNVLENKRKKLWLSNIENLNRRKKKLLIDKYMLWKLKTGMNYRHCWKANTQIAFFHKNRKFVSWRKFRMLKYVINKLSNEKAGYHSDTMLGEKFMFWKNMKKNNLFKVKIGEVIVKTCTVNSAIIYSCLNKWRRWVLIEKINENVWLIQRKYHSYKRRTMKKLNEKV